VNRLGNVFTLERFPGWCWLCQWKLVTVVMLTRVYYTVNLYCTCTQKYTCYNKTWLIFEVHCVTVCSIEIHKTSYISAVRNGIKWQKCVLLLDKYTCNYNPKLCTILNVSCKGSRFQKDVSKRQRNLFALLNLLTFTKTKHHQKSQTPVMK